MPTLVTRQQFRTIKDLDFCYLCEKSFEDDDVVDEDHVPPKNLFLTCDRDFPLKLRVHSQCNNQESSQDQLIGQLVSLLHKKKPSKKARKLQVKAVRSSITGDERLAGCISGLDIKGIIFRWVRGFHAALYEDYLPRNIVRAVHPPLPTGSEGGVGQVLIDRALLQEPKIVEVIKKSIAAKSVDSITSCGGKMVYKCAWTTLDNGVPVCVFALNVYDWIRLCPDQIVEAKGCYGLYVPKKGFPKGATKTTELEFDLDDKAPLDPFG